jgi:hypothetical protein
MNKKELKNHLVDCILKDLDKCVIKTELNPGMFLVKSSIKKEILETIKEKLQTIKTL